MVGVFSEVLSQYSCTVLILFSSDAIQQGRVMGSKIINIDTTGYIIIQIDNVKTV